MFANVIQSLTSDLNWFDAVVVLVLGFGLFRGRRNGMSKEILPLFQWLGVILVSGLFYGTVTQLIAKMVKLDPLISNLVAYTTLAAVVFLFFSLINRTVGLKLFGSNLFGSAEYYIGMPSGMVRFGCILIFALAFLNARHYTAAQIEDSNKYQERWYGAHFFPIYTPSRARFSKNPLRDLIFGNILACC